jgi:hypothetical protein
MKISVDECPAGYWMDVAIAQEIGFAGDDVFRPSTDMVVVDEFIDRLTGMGYKFLMGCYDSESGEHFCTAQVLNGESGFVTTANTRPLAISRLFLKASGIEYVEVE